MPTISEQLRAAGVLPPEPQKPQAPKDERGILERFFSPILPSTTASDYWEGPKYVAQHPLDSLSLLGGAVAKDPAGVVPVVGQVKHGIEDIGKGDYAGAGGNALMAVLSLLPFMRKANVSAAGIGESLAGGAGKALNAVGEGADVAASGLNHPLIGAKVPYAAAKVGGAAARKVGSALEGMAERSYEARTPDAWLGKGNVRPKRVSKEVPGGTYSESPVDRYMPNKSADVLDSVPPAEDLLPTSNEPSFNPRNRATAEAENLQNGASYGNGHVMQEPKPTELLDMAMEGIDPQSTGTYTSLEGGYGAVVPDDFTFEAGNPDVPGLTIGDDLGSIDGVMSPLPETRTSSAVRELPRQDEYWGIRDGEMPQAAPRKGDVGFEKGADPANLLYDPQTPSSYLRDQLSEAGDPGHREFLARAIRQRRDIERALSGMQQ